MLSKSQARLFFLSMTGGFSGVFLWLTADSLSQVPQRSHADQLTAEVVRGKEIWESNNCMGCHTILGEGAYYAPELTKVVERRGAAWIRQFLRDPEAMFPGRRKMVQYDFTEAQISDVIAFLTWVGKIDTNGFPREPDLAPPQSAAVAKVDLASAPRPIHELCIACHVIGGKGGAVGPSLDGIASRRDAAWLDQWLTDPAAIKPTTTMPNPALTPADRAEVVAFLSTLR